MLFARSVPPTNLPVSNRGLDARVEKTHGDIPMLQNTHLCTSNRAVERRRAYHLHLELVAVVLCIGDSDAKLNDILANEMNHGKNQGTNDIYIYIYSTNGGISATFKAFYISVRLSVAGEANSPLHGLMRLPQSWFQLAGVRGRRSLVT